MDAIFSVPKGLGFVKPSIIAKIVLENDAEIIFLGKMLLTPQSISIY
jgi:hypothetical protein